ncbi:hypothetical protein BDW75DRAFT_146925 [Aspergillus navahoensis]
MSNISLATRSLGSIYGIGLISLCFNGSTWANGVARFFRHNLVMGSHDCSEEEICGHLITTYVHWRVYKIADTPTLSLPPLPASESVANSFFFSPSLSSLEASLSFSKSLFKFSIPLFAMKLLSVSVVFAALLATTVQAAPAAEAAPFAEPQKWCRFPGQICDKSKHDTEAEAAPVAEPQNRSCRFSGQICGKAKRTIDALDVIKREADAVAEPFRIHRWCRFPGQICGKAKRTAKAIENFKRSAEAVAEAMAFLDELTPEENAQLEENFGKLEEELDKPEE